MYSRILRRRGKWLERKGLTPTVHCTVACTLGNENVGAVNTSVTLVVQYIGNTFTLMVHTFVFRSLPSGSRRQSQNGVAPLQAGELATFLRGLQRAPGSRFGGAVQGPVHVAPFVAASLRSKLRVVSSYWPSSSCPKWTLNFRCPHRSNPTDQPASAEEMKILCFA